MANIERITVMGRDWPCGLFIDVLEPKSPMDAERFEEITYGNARQISEWLRGNLPRQTTEKIAEMLK